MISPSLRLCLEVARCNYLRRSKTFPVQQRCPFSTNPRWTEAHHPWATETQPAYASNAMSPFPLSSPTNFDSNTTMAYSLPLKQRLRLAEMIPHIPLAIQIRKERDIPVGDPADPILRLLSALNSETIQDEIRPYCFRDPSKAYTRNLIATDHTSYTLLALCWSVGQCSPIHDHPGDGCYMRVIEGAIFEKRYRLVEESTSRLVCTAHDVYTPNQLAFIHDVMGLHQIGCHNHHSAYWNYHGLVSSQSAVSLHLYTPPIRHCHVYSSAKVGSEETPTVQVRDSGPMPHYSEYGRKCSPQ